MKAEPTSPTVGQLLRSRRMRAGLSQLELAARAGIGVRTLRNLEQDRVARPHALSLRRVASALELSEADVDALLALVGRGRKQRDDEVVRVAVLGPLAVWRGGAVVEIGSVMLRRLLGLLALQPDRVVLPEEIVEVVWEYDPPRSYRSLIQVDVGQLRGLLEPGRGRRAPGAVVAYTAGGYRLRLGPDRLDLARFDDLAGRGLRARQDGDPDTARDLLDQALACWRGPVLTDLGERLRQHPAAVAVARRRVSATLAYADLAADPGGNDTTLVRLRALALAQRVGWLDGQAAAANLLGLVYWKYGRLQQAVAHLLHALALNRRTGQSHGEARNLGNLALVYREMGRLRAAVGYEHSAIAIAQGTSYRVGEANGRGDLGKLAHDLGRFDTALGQLTTTLSLHRELGNRGGEADVLCTLARVHRDAGRGRVARTLATGAVTLAADVADREVEADALNTLATIHLRLGRLQDAVDHFRQALSLAIATGNRYPEIEALIGLADYHRQRAAGGGEAVEYACQALNLSRLGGYRMLEGQALTALAAAHLAGRRIDLALPEARQAVAIHQETGHRLGEARAHMLLGHAYWQAGMPGAAETSVRRALVLFAEIGVPEAERDRALL